MSPDDRKRNNYAHYLNVLSREREPFPCPRCETRVLAKKFENHCLQCHDINGRRCCVWCWGNFSWPDRKKSENADHLKDCFRKFVEAARAAEDGEGKDACVVEEGGGVNNNNVNQPVLMNSDPIDPAGIFFRYPNDNEAIPLEDSMPFLEVGDASSPLRFEGENVDLAVSCVRKYHLNKSSSDWFHAMVKLVAYQSFVRVMEEDPHSRILEFSCWCDGGKNRERAYRQHRHLIVVCSQKNDYYRKRVWPRVKAERRPYSNFPCKRLKKIKSPMHLVNTIGYMCQRKSRCDFSFKEELASGKRGPMKKNHFYIYKSLPKYFRFPLVLQWDGGIMQLLYQESLKNVSALRISETHLSKENNKWQQKLKDFYKLKKNLVLPVSNEFVPTLEPTDYYVSLVNDRKLYFKKNFENIFLNWDDWLQKQIDGNNLFYNILEEETWVPGKTVQGRLNEIMSIKKEKDKLKHDLRESKKQSELEISRWKSEYENLRVKSEDEIESLKKKYDSKCAKLEKEIKLEQAKLDKLKDDEIARLKEEIKLERAKFNDLQQKYDQLQEKFNDLKDNEIVRLIGEVEYFKTRFDKECERLNKKYEDEITNLRKENLSLKEEISTFKEEMSNLKQENCLLRRELDSCKEIIKNFVDTETE